MVGHGVSRSRRTAEKKAAGLSPRAILINPPRTEEYRCLSITVYARDARHSRKFAPRRRPVIVWPRRYKIKVRSPRYG